MDDKSDGKRWGVIAIAISVLCALAIYGWLRGWPISIDKDLTLRDASVIKAATKHFVEHAFPYSRAKSEETLVVIDKQTLGYYRSAPQLNEDWDGRKWEVPRDCFRNLVSRNAEPVSTQSIRLADAGAVIDDLGQMGTSLFDMMDALQKRYPNFKQHDYVRLWLPGCSSDGTQALVMFQFGPSPHGADADYLLEKKGTSWVVREYALHWYL